VTARLASPFVLAHTGHALVDLGAFVVPLVFMIVYLKVVDRRRNRRLREHGERPSE
jgi:hypothetical protein